jgi:hypothetical protein
VSCYTLLAVIGFVMNVLATSKEAAEQTVAYAKTMERLLCLYQPEVIQEVHLYIRTLMNAEKDLVRFAARLRSERANPTPGLAMPLVLSHLLGEMETADSREHLVYSAQAMMPYVVFHGTVNYGRKFLPDLTDKMRAKLTQDNKLDGGAFMRFMGDFETNKGNVLYEYYRIVQNEGTINYMNGAWVYVFIRRLSYLFALVAAQPDTNPKDFKDASDHLAEQFAAMFGVTTSPTNDTIPNFVLYPRQDDIYNEAKLGQEFTFLGSATEGWSFANERKAIEASTQQAYKPASSPFLAIKQ